MVKHENLLSVLYRISIISSVICWGLCVDAGCLICVEIWQMQYKSIFEEMYWRWFRVIMKLCRKQTVHVWMSAVYWFIQWFWWFSSDMNEWLCFCWRCQWTVWQWETSMSRWPCRIVSTLLMCKASSFAGITSWPTLHCGFCKVGASAPWACLTTCVHSCGYTFSNIRLGQSPTYAIDICSQSCHYLAAPFVVSLCWISYYCHILFRVSFIAISIYRLICSVMCPRFTSRRHDTNISVTVTVGWVTGRHTSDKKLCYLFPKASE